MFKLPTVYDSEVKLWRGPEKKLIFNEEMSLGQTILYMMRSKHPENIMQISDSENITLTCGQVLTISIRIAQHLHEMQLTADDVVSIFAPNISYILPVILGSWFNGCPIQATNFKSEPNVVQHIYGFVQPKVIFCDGHYYEKVKEASKLYKPLIYTLCNHLDGVPKLEDLLEPTESEHIYQAEPLKYGVDQTVAIMISSGTTGLPKGVCISKRNNVNPYGVTDGSSVLFTTSSIDWSAGLLTVLMVTLVGGTRIISTKTMSPEYLLELIVKYKISFLVTNPDNMIPLSLLPNCTPEAMQSIRVMYITGAYCSEAALKRMRAALTKGVLVYIYGCTEIGCVTENFSNYKPKSVGKMVSNLELKIIDPLTSERLGPLKSGEICVKHKYPIKGYYKNPEATKILLDNENFIRTGDLGFMDEENFLYINGRFKDIRKYGNYHYSPTEIEDIIIELPDVVDVCVFSVFDELKYDLSAAAVIKKEHSSLTASEIIAYVHSRTEATQKQIHYGVFFVKELSRNQNGKFLRDKVRDICLAMEKEGF